MCMSWTCLAVGGVTVWTTPGEPRHANLLLCPVQQIHHQLQGFLDHRCVC